MSCWTGWHFVTGDGARKSTVSPTLLPQRRSPMSPPLSVGGLGDPLLKGMNGEVTVWVDHRWHGDVPLVSQISCSGDISATQAPMETPGVQALRLLYCQGRCPLGSSSQLHPALSPQPGPVSLWCPLKDCELGGWACPQCWPCDPESAEGGCFQSECYGEIFTKK